MNEALKNSLEGTDQVIETSRATLLLSLVIQQFCFPEK